MSSNAGADANATPRLKSAVLWGVLGALFFLVLHQVYLLLDGEFLGVGPVAAVAVGVFLATVVASYLTAGRLDVIESEESTVEAAEAGEPAATTEPDATGPVADGSLDDESDGEESGGGEQDEEAADGEDEWIWGGQDG